MALYQRKYKQVVETTVELTQKAGASKIIGWIVNEPKDKAEPYWKMVMETIIASLGASDVDEKLDICLVDGIIYSFQEQMAEDQVMLDRFGTAATALKFLCREKALGAMRH